MEDLRDTCYRLLKEEEKHEQIVLEQITDYPCPSSHKKIAQKFAQNMFRYEIHIKKLFEFIFGALVFYYLSVFYAICFRPFFSLFVLIACLGQFFLFILCSNASSLCGCLCVLLVCLVFFILTYFFINVVFSCILIMCLSVCFVCLFD